MDDEARQGSPSTDVQNDHLSARGVTRRWGLAAAVVPALASAFGIRAARADSGDSTFDRVRSTKVLRIAALPGELPYFQKDLATGEWSGAAISMAQDIAKVFA